MKEKKWLDIPEVLFFQEGPGVRKHQYTTSGVKLLNVANLQNGKVDLSTSERYISNDEAYGKYSHFLVEEGDFIIASSGIKVEYFERKMGFITEEHLPLCMNTSTIRFRSLNDDILDIKYFMYFLKSKAFKHQLARQITGSAQLNFGPSHLKKMRVPIIDIDEQHDVINKLSKLEQIISARQKQLEEYDTLIKSRFIEMFGNPANNSKGWEEIPLDKCLINIDNGTSFKCDSKKRSDKNSGLLKLSAVTYGVFLPEENKALLDEGMFVEKARVVEGDLLFTRKNTPELVGMAAYVQEPTSNLMMPDLIFRLNTNELCNKVFLWKLINLDVYRPKIMALASGSAKSMSNISKSRLKELTIPLPPIELQNEFEVFVQQTNKLKFEVRKSLEETQILFDSLMQEYFD